MIKCESDIQMNGLSVYLVQEEKKKKNRNKINHRVFNDAHLFR